MKPVHRRTFLQNSGKALAAVPFIDAALVKGTTANSKIKLGLIGCGGRGLWIANLFAQHGGFEISALADYFKDRTLAGTEQFNVPSQRCFTGLSAYQQLLDAGVDAIAIESPPYFHPEQAAAGVDSGVHVYLAKPIAVDVPGCESIQQSAERAGQKNLAFLIDFQTRANGFYIQALQRVHDGAIGDFAFGEAIYHAEFPFKSQAKLLAEKPHDPEVRLRAWGCDFKLSGDIITEQNIHTLDVMSWIMNKPPLFAVGSCGHKVRNDPGSCNDHYALIYQYPDEVGITFSSRQFNGHGTQPEGIRNRMFGSKGVLETEYGGQVLIRGENFYRGGATTGIYKEGAIKNIASFYDQISSGPLNYETVSKSVQSNLVTLLGREAAMRNEQVYWVQLLKSTDRLEPDLRGLES
jgi:predicted dehydrogenase